MNFPVPSGLVLSSRLCVTLILLGVCCCVKSQPAANTARFGPPIDDNINGFWEYLPRNYKTDLDQRYPLIIFFHGYADSGSSPDSATLTKVLNAGTPLLINSGNFPDSFNVGGKWHKFVVIAPQIKNGFSSDEKTSNVLPSTIDALINFATSTYRIDTKRIYLCGLSMGGGIVSSYAGSSLAAANRLAAIGIAAGAAELDTLQTDNIAAANMGVLATHNTIDDVIPVSRTLNNMEKLKKSKDKVKNKSQSNQVEVDTDPAVFYWDLPLLNDKHNAWTRTFEDITPGTTIGGNLADRIGVSVYEWLLSYSRDVENVLPLKWESFTLSENAGNVALEWSTSREVNVSSFVVEKSPEGSDWAALAIISPSSVPGAVNAYRFIDTTPFENVNFYRIKQVDKDGKFSYSFTKQISIAQANASAVRVYPNPFDRELSLIIPRSAQQGLLIVKLLDTRGAVVRYEKYSTQGAGTTLTLNNLQRLGSGFYFLTIQNADGKVLAKQKIFKR